MVAVVDVQHGVVVALQLKHRAAALAGDRHAGVPAVGPGVGGVAFDDGVGGVGEEEWVPHVDGGGTTSGTRRGCTVRPHRQPRAR